MRRPDRARSKSSEDEDEEEKEAEKNLKEPKSADKPAKKAPAKKKVAA